MPLTVGPSPIFKPWIHEQGRSDVVLPGKTVPATNGNPFNMQDNLGRFHVVWVSNGNILYRRSDTAYPGSYAVNRVSVSGGTTDGHPRLSMDHRGLLYCCWDRTLDSGNTYNIWESRSDDDGATWNTAYMSISGGRKPTIEHGNDGTGIRGAVMIPGAAGTPAVISFTRQYTGDITPSSTFNAVDSTGAAIQFADDTFHISNGRELSGRWYLTGMPFGGGDPIDWWSGDDCNSWTRIA